jgi:hypothetical protein
MKRNIIDARLQEPFWNIIKLVPLYSKAYSFIEMSYVKSQKMIDVLSGVIKIQTYISFVLLTTELKFVTRL